MRYTQLDRLISEVLNLEEGSIFVLKKIGYDSLLAFSYPYELRGSTISIINQNLLGKALIHRSPIILNQCDEEMDSAYLRYLAMKNSDVSIKKMIAYPVCTSDEFSEVILIMRKKREGAEVKDFLGEDLVKIKKVLDSVFTARLEKPAFSANGD
ncbi:MAG TPA: hypothetical protein VNN20_09620 [Thermodesulfobacteriota bacterium]|nr:hypothetical protein [Thermodesulfobacteriota bacterium]